MNVNLLEMLVPKRRIVISGDTHLKVNSRLKMAGINE